MKMFRVGVLALQGDVSEHIRAIENAARRLRRNVRAVPVRTREELGGIGALVMPGGESTTLQKLCEREEMFGAMKRIRRIFGTCAGAILLAKRIEHKAPGQKTLELMNITADRNAYGTQSASFEEDLDTDLGPVHAVFVRAPRIADAGKDVNVLARNGSEIVACEEKIGGRYYLASAFHPELTTTAFHEHFLRNCT